MYYNPQQNAYNNLAGMSYGVPANCSPYMRTIGGYNSNIVPMGYGYNGGYYSGYYNQYNPYQIKQQQEMMLAQQREAQRQQSDIFQSLCRCSAYYQYGDVSQETIDNIDPYKASNYVDPDDISDFSYDEQKEYFRILNLENSLRMTQNMITQMNTMQNGYIQNYNPQAQAYCNGYCKMIEDYNKKLGNIGLAEYMEKYAGIEYMEALEHQSKNNQNNVRSLYNHNDYNSLLNRHKEGLFGSNVFNPNASIDDQEIKLPQLVSEKTKQERRRLFMEAVLSNGVNTHG